MGYSFCYSNDAPLYECNHLNICSFFCAVKLSLPTKFIATIRIRKIIKYPCIIIRSQQSDIKCRDFFHKTRFLTHSKNGRRRQKKIIAMLLSNPQTTIPLPIAHSSMLLFGMLILSHSIFYLFYFAME